MGMDSSPDTHIIEVEEPYFAGGDFLDAEPALEVDPAGEDRGIPGADEGAQVWLDEIDAIESGAAEADPAAGVYGQSVEGLPAELQFGGHYGSFGDVEGAWYSSDGKVYDPAGRVLGYH
jgi:hypothetical protein